MIIFHRLWATMESRGISMYQLREKCGIDSKTIRRLRANENIETKTLDKLCSALHCNLDDIAEYKESQTVFEHIVTNPFAVHAGQRATRAIKINT